MPNPSIQHGQRKPGQKQRRQRKKAKTKPSQTTPEMEQENVLRYLQDVFKDTLDSVLIHSVLQDYNYDVEKTLETLCVVAEGSVADSVNKKVPSFKDITTGLQKMKDGEDDYSSDEEESERDEEDSSQLNCATNVRDEANPFPNSGDSSLDLPLLPKPSLANCPSPNVFKLSELQQDTKGSGASHYNFESYYEAEYGTRMQPENSSQNTRFGTGAAIDAMLEESKIWNNYGANDSTYQTQLQMPAHLYGYYGNPYQVSQGTRTAWNSGMLEPHLSDPTTSQGQMFRMEKAESSQHGSVNQGNLSQTGRSGQLPDQTNETNFYLYKQNNSTQRTGPENAQPNLKSTGLSQKQTNFLANKQKNQAERSLGNVSTPAWPNRKTNIVPSASHIKAASKSDDVTPLPKGKVLCLMRGLPGSGKSTLAKKLLGSSKSGVILSTDDYFVQPDGKYQFNPRGLDRAHRETQQHAKDAMMKGQTPVIIDNTNTQLWEMKPYVVWAQQFHYKVEIREPSTPWKHKVGELVKRNTHGVPKEKIGQMLERFEKVESVESILRVPNKFEVAGTQDKMDARASAKSPVQEKPRNPIHFKPKALTQEKIQSPHIPNIQRSNGTPKSSLSGSTSGKENSSSFETTAKISSCRLARETLKHAQRSAPLNALPPENNSTSTEQRGDTATSSTDSNLSEIHNVVTSIPIASCLQDKMYSFQEKLNDINDISVLLDQASSGEKVESTQEHENKDKKAMKPKVADVREELILSQSGEEAPSEVMNVETENEREVEGASSPEQVTATSYQESSVDPPGYDRISTKLSDKRQLESADNDHNEEKKYGSLSEEDGDGDDSGSPKEKAPHLETEFEKYLTPSKPDDVSSEPDLVLGTKSPRESNKRDDALLHAKDKELDQVVVPRPASNLSHSGTSVSSEHSRSSSVMEDLKPNVLRLKQQGAEGLSSSRSSSHSTKITKTSHLVSNEKPDANQKKLEVSEELTQFGASLAKNDVENVENGSYKSLPLSHGTSKQREHVSCGENTDVDTVTHELSGKGATSNWDETGAKPKMKRAFSEPPTSLQWNPTLHVAPSSPTAGGTLFQSLSTVPQIRKKNRRALTPFGRRILAPNFSYSALPSVSEPDLVFGGNKSGKMSEEEKKSSVEEGKQEVRSESTFQAKERKAALGENMKGDCARKLSFEQLSEKRVEDRTEPIPGAGSPRKLGHEPFQEGEEEEKSRTNLNVLNDSVKISEGKPPTETSEGVTVGHKDTNPPVKRKTARHPKMKSPPLLDEQTRLTALTKNWSSGAITREVLKPPVALSSQTTVSSNIEMQHHGSQTDISHFNLLERVNLSLENEDILEGNFKVRWVTPGVWNGTGETAAVMNESKTDDIPHRRKIDKSSMTEESKMHNPEGGLDLLSSIFPHLGKDQIREVLQRCKGNAQWASEILVESNHLSTEKRKREQKHNKKVLSQNDQEQRSHHLQKSTTSSQTSRADFLFLKLTVDGTKVLEETPNFKVLSPGEWQEVCVGGAGRDQAEGTGITHVTTHVDFEELMPNFDEDLSKLLQAHLDVPLMEVCAGLEKNEGDVAKTEMELRRKYHEEQEESPHSLAGRDIASQERTVASASRRIYLSSGMHKGSSGISVEGQVEQRNFPKTQISSNSVTPEEPRLQKGSTNNRRQDVQQSLTAKKFMYEEQASFSDQESSHRKRGREISERNKDSKRSHRGRSRSLPRKKTEDQKSATFGGSKKQTSSGPDGRRKDLPHLEPKSVHTQGQKGVKNVRHARTEQVYKGLPDKYNFQNLKKTMETPDDSSSSGSQSVVEGAVGYDRRLTPEGANHNQDSQVTSSVNDKQREQSGAEVKENQGKGQEAVAEASPSDLLNEVGKGVPTRFHQGMMFQLDMAFALQLQEIFGSVGYCIDTDVLSEDDLAIPVDLHLAKAIHTAWCKSFKQKFDREEAQLLEMMKQDEALAKKLQEEEEKMKLEEEQKKREEQYLGKNRGQQTTMHHGMPVSPIVGHQSYRGQLASGISGLPSHGLHSPVGNLRDIMADHVAEEIGNDMQREDALSTEKANTMAVKLRRKQLIEKYPGVNQSWLEDIFMRNNFEIDPTMKEIDAIVKTVEGARNVYSAESLQRMEEEQLKRALEQSVEGQFQRVTNRRSPKTQRRQQPQQDDEEPDLKKNNKFQSLEHPDYHDYRAEANLHYRQRQECFRKASEAFAKGQSQLAAYYSEEGHKHTALLREANQRASEAILADKNKEQDDDTLDLHGLHVDEALEALETKMVEKSTRLKYSNPFLPPSPHLFIITGKGNHSKAGVAKIKPAVINFLKTKGYRFEIMNQGMLKVKL